MSKNLNDLNTSTKLYDGWQQEEKEITFDGGTTNAIGDHDGTGDPFTIFNVTGTVKAKVIGICTTTLSGASATLEVGVTGTTAGIIAQTSADAIDVNEIWHDATPDASVELESVMAEKIISNGLDIQGLVGTANIVSGKIKFLCIWRPLSMDGEVSAA